MPTQTPFLRSKVSRRILLLVVLCVLIPVGMTGALAFHEVTGHLKSRTDQYLRQTSKATGMVIFERLLLAEADLSRMKASYLPKTNPREAAVAPYISESLQWRFQGVGWLAGNSELLPLFGEIGALPTLDADEQRHLETGRTLLSTRPQDSASAGVYMLLPISSDSESNQYLIGQLNADYLWAGLQDEERFGSPKFCIFDRANQALYRSFPGCATIPSPAKAEMDQSLSAPFEWSDEGDQYLAHFWSLFLKAQFFNPKWTIVSAQSSTVVLAPVAEFRRKFPLVIVLGILLALLLSANQIRRNLRPLEELREAASRIARRDFTVRASVTSGDEFEELGRSFNSMTEQLAMQFESLKTEKERAEAATIAKSQFLTNMSHEIRTPMNAILGYVELINDPTTSRGERAGLSEGIQRSGNHLMGVLDNILDISQVEAGKVRLAREWVSPAAICADVRFVFQHQATEKGVQFEVECDESLPPAMLTDPGRLRQVIVNLVGNAIKFTDSGFVRVTATAQGKGGKDNLEISVSDSGIGMGEETQARVFFPFEQGDTTSTRQFGGAGLGLAIAKQFVELLDGEIAVQSEPGRGSLFTVTVPIGAAPELEVTSEKPCERETSPSLESGSKASPKRLSGRVLLAEDGPDNQVVMRHFLEKAGLDVEIAENGLVACEMVLAARDRGEPFSLILMDIDMPVMDGCAATKRLRESGVAEPIIALTAHALTGDRESCVAAGCSDYGSKPITRDTLLSLVTRYLADQKSDE